MAALDRLGAEAVHWPYTDCIYRQTPDGSFPYASEAALWGEVHPTEESLATELAARMAALPLKLGGTVYAPLTVKHHVDHQITCRAASDTLALAAPGHTLTHYEEFPYAQDPQAVQVALSKRQGQAELVPLSEQALEAKTAAIACYHSQLSTFWTGETEMATAVRAFAERVGGGNLAEQYWKLETEAGQKGGR